MLTVLLFVAILIVCAVITVFWMSRAPHIEESVEKKIQSRVASFAKRNIRFHQRRVEPKHPKARGA